MSLKVAVDKINDWYKKDGLVASPRDAALLHMGFEKFTGDAGRLLSALKSYGLVQDTDGRLKLTPRGVDIVARQDGDPKKATALQDAAKGPAIYKDLLKTYASGLPSDPTLKSELIAGKGFNPKSVDDFIKDFQATLKYAGISSPAVLDSEQGDDDGSDENHIQVGDYVQWESLGVLQFAEPKQIKGFSDDGQWAFIEGGAKGVPVKELTVADAPVSDTLPPPPALKGKGAIPPPSPFPVERGISKMLQDVFSLTEGPVTIQWPTSLSPESFEDLSAWLDILKRKIGRSVKAGTIEGGE
ncbi:MAG: hypothetical protein M3O35_13605 [Acidobacteriota bacterium]|nr:hypothetical protein [Acidobacteriota bacterium]